MSRGPLVSPRGYQTPGGVPRGLLSGTVAVVAAIALLLWWWLGDDRPAPRTADARAREQLGRAEAVQAQPRGAAVSVDEAADRAALAARRGESLAVAAAAEAAVAGGGRGEGASPGGQSAGHGGGPAVGRPRAPGSPSDAPSSAGPDALAVDVDGRDEAGRTARELEARGSEGRIFDEAGEQGGRRPSALSALTSMGLMAPDGLALGVAAPVVGTAAASWQVSGFAGVPSPGLATPTAPEAGLEHVAGVLQQLAPAQAPDAARRSEQWQRQAAPPPPVPALAARPAAAALVVEEGTVIPAVLLRRISSDSPGVVTAMVSMDVYDSRTARSLLLPKGARLVGRYNTDVAMGQARMQLAFTRLILPDGSSFDLPGAVGSDAAGQGGLEADVDRHFLRSFGSALLIGVLADHVVRPQAAPAPGTYGSGLSATGQVLVDTATAELQRHSAIPPTLSVAEGTRVNVEVVRDMSFPRPYRLPS